MSHRNLWYDCMFINMRIVVLILPVLVCDDILTVRIFTINRNLPFLSVLRRVWSGLLVCFVGRTQGCVTERTVLRRCLD